MTATGVSPMRTAAVHIMRPMAAGALRTPMEAAHTMEMTAARGIKILMVADLIMALMVTRIAIVPMTVGHQFGMMTRTMTTKMMMTKNMAMIPIRERKQLGRL